MTSPSPKHVLHYFSIIPVLLLDFLVEKSVGSALVLITINILYMVSFAPVVLESGRRVAWKANISAFIIALVIIPFLSSFHEIMVSVLSNITRPDLNVIVLAQQMGNKLFELLVVFSVVGLLLCRSGHCIAISDEKERYLTKRNGVLMIGGIALLALLIFSDGALLPFDGLLLVLYYLVFLAFVHQTRRRGITEIDISELGSKESIKGRVELSKLIASVFAISLLARAIVDQSSFLIDTYDFFSHYAFIVIGIIAALPNLIISIIGIRKNATTFVVALNIGSALWEMTISVAIIAFTSPLVTINSLSVVILSVALLSGAVAVVVFIRTHFWRLKAWECALLLAIYGIAIACVFAFA